VTQTAAKPQPEAAPRERNGEILLPEVSLEDTREWQAERLRLLWSHRGFFLRATVAGLLASTLVAFLIPKSYTATTQLMPPDPQSASGMAMMAAMATKAGGLGAMAGDLLGLKSSGAMFVGVLRSQTTQEHLIDQFDLKKVYGKRLSADARIKLDENTAISEDRKSGIIAISVTDHSPQRAAAMASAYVDQLDVLVAGLSTTAAHRERVFLEDRLHVSKQDLDDATSQLAQFSSKNHTLDIQQEGKALLDAAGSIAGQMIAAQSQLEGLRQIYTDNNPRVRALNARVGELRRQLEKLGGVEAKDAPNSAPPSAGQSDGPVFSQTSGLPYPTIRSLPLLGAKYADYYRRAKVQETVFELLTEQYELAKVQEAKETPSVKVLDPARVPEKRSFPPRLMIISLGTFIGCACSVIAVLGTASWHDVDPQDPRKKFVQEVAHSLHARMPWAARNGNAVSPSNEGSAEEQSRKPWKGSYGS
jgi:capsule polysaccharide export protein KpsE/RkpR